MRAVAAPSGPDSGGRRWAPLEHLGQERLRLGRGDGGQVARVGVLKDSRDLRRDAVRSQKGGQKGGSARLRTAEARVVGAAGVAAGAWSRPLAGSGLLEQHCGAVSFPQRQAACGILIGTPLGPIMAIRAAGSLAALLGLGLAPSAAAQDCRLALVLALDVSSSVDAREHELQRRGLARALLAPEVGEAFLSGEPVALHAFEWSGPPVQIDLLPGWAIIDDATDLSGVAALLLSHPRSAADARNQSTGLGSALSHAAKLLGDAPPCRARTVDVSGDGENNAGLEPSEVYLRDPFEDVTVNALVVGQGPRHADADLDEDALVAWFRAEVLHGPGAFHVLADGYEDFERAMSVKLRRELVPLLASAAPQPRGPAHELID